jgi:hypothetical protein
VRKFLKETQFLLLFFFILTVTTVLSYIDFNPEKISARTPAEILKDAPSSKSLLENEEALRMPASIETTHSEMINAEIFCQKNEDALFKKSMKSLVMLNFKVCPDLKSTRHVWIKNETNGFRAQIFKNGNKKFRTDFIQLNTGVNKLVIEAVLKDGQKRVQSLEIISGS